MRKKLKITGCILSITVMMLLTGIPSLNAFSIEDMIEIDEVTSTLVPDLVYFPMSHDFGTILEGQLYQTTFDIWNGGTGTLTWSLGIVDPWINPQPTSGSSTGEHDTVTVRIDTTGLSAGSYSGSIGISANDGGGLRFFSVSFVITDNDPPNTPSQLTGPSSGFIGDALIFTTSTTDPNGDNVMYGFDYNEDDAIDFWSSSYYPSGATYEIHITFYSPGVFPLRVLAKDVYGAMSGFSPAKIVTISGSSNDPPSTPSTPSGPDSGNTGVSYTYSTSTIDPDGDQVKYGWDWDGDGTVDEWSNLKSSGATDTRSHIWVVPGTYTIKVIAEDEHGAKSSYSLGKTVMITANQPPNKPSLTGPSSGKTGTSYAYTAANTDDDADNLYYLFDWGDSTQSGWIGPFSSGQSASESHIWTSQGAFNVKVKTRDVHGAESIWSDPIPISIPKCRSLSVFQVILEYFPFLSSFLQWVS